MNDKQMRLVAAGALMAGALLGMAGAFAPTAGLRGLVWGIDGTAVVVGCAELRCGQRGWRWRVRQGDGRDCCGVVRGDRRSDFRRGEFDAAIATVAVFRISISGSDARRLGVGARGARASE
jgi:hypothetical protein